MAIDPPELPDTPMVMEDADEDSIPDAIDFEPDIPEADGPGMEIVDSHARLGNDGNDHREVTLRGSDGDATITETHTYDASETHETLSRTVETERADGSIVYDSKTTHESNDGDAAVERETRVHTELDADGRGTRTTEVTESRLDEDGQHYDRSKETLDIRVFGDVDDPTLTETRDEDGNITLIGSAGEADDFTVTEHHRTWLGIDLGVDGVTVTDNHGNSIDYLGEDADKLTIRVGEGDAVTAPDDIQPHVADEEGNLLEQ